MTRALLIVDVQNDFTEGGALGVTGGAAIAAGVNELLRGADRYELVVASRDWHNAEGSNGGHFAPGGVDPDYEHTWPVHCVADTPGAEYHPSLRLKSIDVHIRKGMGEPAYSAFEGETTNGQQLAHVLAEREIVGLDIVGLATDFCVLQTGLDAVRLGLSVRVHRSLVAGVDPERSVRALEALAEAGAEIV